MNARLRLAFAGERTWGKPCFPYVQTMFPPRAPFFLRTWATSRFPTPVPGQRREVGP